AALARQLLERRPRVGDRRPEPTLRVEVVRVRACLERRARLRRRDEERPRDVQLRLQRPDRLRVRRVEHVERLLAERAPQHLGRERRAAHAEQDDVVDAVDDRVRELEEQVDVLAHPPRLVEPARIHAAASVPRLARMLSRIWSNESANFCTPSCSSTATTSSYDTPASASCASSRRASSMPASTVAPRISPWSWKASIVSSGIVLTVSGPISSST